MGIINHKSASNLADHLRSLREQYDLTLDNLAQQSGLSRSTLSRIEKNEVSPTAEALGRLASVYSLPISQLLAPMEQSFQPVVRQQDQSIWRDPVHNYTRRSISPPNGQLKLELIEGAIGPNQQIAYSAPAFPGQEHHVYLLSGEMELTVEGQTHSLKAGDCLRYLLHGATEFKTFASPCRYVIALS